MAAPADRFAHLPRVVPHAVIFDMDGLMLDTERLDRTLWRDAALRHGFDFPDTLHGAMVGRRAADSRRLLQEHFGPQFALEPILAELDAHWRAHAQRGMPRKAGLGPLLDLLERTGVPRAVATSTARERAMLSLGSLAGRFGAIACGDEVDSGKPAPDLFLLAARRLGVAPELCLALEDSPAGVAAASAAGMAVIMIPDLVEPAEAPPHLGKDLDEVHLWLQERLATEHAERPTGGSPP